MSLAQPHHIDWDSVESFEELNNKMNRICADLDDDLVSITSQALGMASSLIQHGVLVGSATSPTAKSVDPGTSGQVLKSNGASADPTFQNTDPITFHGGAVPATPVAGDAVLYATTNQGHTQLDLIDEGGTILRMNRDLALIVRNTSGSPITKGQLLNVNGSTGSVPTVNLADADISTPPIRHAEGAAAEAIADNGYGLMLLSGQLSSFDTSAWAEGTQLYTSGTAGAFTSTPPTFPAFVQKVAVVTRQHATQGSVELLIDSLVAPITEGAIILSDVTTDDVSITKHGFAPKAPNDTLKFLRGDASWAVNLNDETKYATITRPVNGDFSWINQGSSTIRDDTDSVVLTGAGTGTGVNLVARVKAIPTVPYVITARILPMLIHKAFNSYGLCFRQSSDGKLHVFDIMGTDAGLTTLTLRSTKYTGPTAGATVTDYQTLKLPFEAHWLRIADNNTNRICSISADGFDWIQIHSIGRTDFITADQVGFFMSTENSVTPNLAPIMRVSSWTQT